MNENGDSGAKLHIDQKSACTIDDVEVCERGVDVIYDVDFYGDSTNYIETWSGDAHYAYYHCRECGESWEIETPSDKEKVWDIVKAHLNE